MVLGFVVNNTNQLAVPAKCFCSSNPLNPGCSSRSDGRLHTGRKRRYLENPLIPATTDLNGTEVEQVSVEYVPERVDLDDGLDGEFREEFKKIFEKFSFQYPLGLSSLPAR
ncbi:hypothetical protein WN943_027360 [Citrus x changshan-huyou]